MVAGKNGNMLPETDREPMVSITLCRRTWSRAARTAIRGALVFALTVESAWAVDLEVRVSQGGDEQPLSGASVCLGVPGSPGQFGAVRTGADGAASFPDVPQMSMSLTVSKPGFRGDQRAIRLQGVDRVMLVRLPSGGGGPECDAQTAGTGQSWSGPDQLWVSEFRINRGAAHSNTRDVRLSFSMQGEPTQYRASEKPDFSDADWKAMQANPAFTLSPGRGSKTVYFQVRRHREVDGATLQSTSNVAADTISLQQ